MIYRLSSNTKDFYYECDYQTPPFGSKYSIHASHYQYQFEEQPMEPSWEHCRVYKAPLLPEWRINTPLTVKIEKKGLSFPGIIADTAHLWVSETAKQVIESVDPFGHQFWPVPVSDKKGRKVSDEQYYRMNMRRFINIDELGGDLHHTDFDLCGTGERSFIPSIQNSRLLRAQVETLPLWQHAPDMRNSTTLAQEVLFMNQHMLDSLVREGVEGLEEIKIVRNRYKGTVGHI